MGKPIAHVGSSTSGHSKCSPPSKLQTSGGNTNVFISTGSACVLVATKGATAVTHGCKDDPPHSDVVTGGSRTVMVGRKGIARKGDRLTKGARILSGKTNYLVK